jgi:hypothetical protein
VEQGLEGRCHRCTSNTLIFANLFLNAIASGTSTRGGDGAVSTPGLCAPLFSATRTWASLR